MDYDKIILEVPEEMNRFLHVMCQPYRPPFFIQQVLEDIVSSIGILEYGDELLVETAINIAYETDQMDHEANKEYRIEAEDIPTGPRRDTYEAVVRLGKDLRDRLFELKAYTGSEGWFPFDFEKIYRDELIVFSKIPIDDNDGHFGIPSI